MIAQLSPLVTPTATAAESPDSGSAREKAVQESENANAFSKLLDGLLKKIKIASEAEGAEETLTHEKASPLLKSKAKSEDSTEGNEGIAALFAPKDGIIKTLVSSTDLPTKAEREFALNGEGIAITEKASLEFGELKLDGLDEKLSAEKKSSKKDDGLKIDAELVSGTKNEKIAQADALVENLGSDFSADDLNQQLDDAENQKIGLIDALKAKTEKQSLVEAPQFNSNAQSALVDSEKKAGSPHGEKVKDKRKERLSMESAEGRINAAQDNSHDGTKLADENFSDQKIDADIIVELRDGRSQGSERGLARESGNAQNFQDMLSRELHNGINTEIVRHANIVLRQNGEGLIRLTLHPESLGNIKIKLEMADNKVSGRIVFESDEAMKAFEKEIASLEKSFVDSGFDGASLEMALSGDHQNDGAGQQWRGEEARPFFSERFVASSYEVPAGIDGQSGFARGSNFALVDIMA
ncbi:MAG: flagellar hook-length control protein FliK [Treponema sp.]|nr:flagellar hook-length control protein FliK [Treponema sp.]